jgi:hypothetical protein
MRFRNGLSLASREVIVERDDCRVAGGPKPRLTFEQYKRIVEVREARSQIPTDKELARELGLNPLSIKRSMIRGIKVFDLMLRRK